MLRKAVDKTRAYYCLECGICTGSCPVSRYDPLYSPRLTVERALLKPAEAVVCDREIWSCLTCGTCNLRCPSTVDYTAFIREARSLARDAGNAGVCTHAEKMEAILDIQCVPGYRRSRTWLGGRTASRSETYYFGGCLPYLDVVFRDLGFAGREIGSSAVALLNRLGIVPAVSPGEVCCGHDAYWTGETGRVRDFAARNVRAVRLAGARRAVFSCPECYYMFKRVYPDMVGELGFEPVLLVNLLAERLADLGFAPSAGKVTYQDPCRLARYEDVIEAPRALLKAVPDVELAEMRRTGKDAVCCGSSSWVSCSMTNKRIQLERLEEAAVTGAGVLVTACPKCNIHLRCAERDKDTAREIEITDVFTLLARSLPAARTAETAGRRAARRGNDKRGDSKPRGGKRGA